MMNSEEVNRAANAVAAAEAELQELPLRDRTRRIQSAIAAQTTLIGATGPMMTEAPPNPTLFVTNLPNDTTREALEVLFREFSGYHDVRLIPGREGIAFIDFDNETGAGSAKGKLVVSLSCRNQNIEHNCIASFISFSLERCSQWFQDITITCDISSFRIGIVVNGVSMRIFFFFFFFFFIHEAMSKPKYRLRCRYCCLCYCVILRKINKNLRSF
jgi:RNA recognition motif-containing protein